MSFMQLCSQWKPLSRAAHFRTAPLACYIIKDRLQLLGIYKNLALQVICICSVTAWLYCCSRGQLVTGSGRCSRGQLVTGSGRCSRGQLVTGSGHCSRGQLVTGSGRCSRGQLVTGSGRCIECLWAHLCMTFSTSFFSSSSYFLQNSSSSVSENFIHSATCSTLIHVHIIQYTFTYIVQKRID